MKQNLRDLFAEIKTEENLKKILLRFYEAMSRDVLIGFFFDGKNLEAIAEKQKEFLLRGWGLSKSYSGKSPAQAHAALPPILSGHFDRRLKILEETLVSAGLARVSIDAWLEFELAFRDAVVK